MGGCPALIALLLLGISQMQWSAAVALSTGICIDRLSSFIISSCNRCIRISLPQGQYIAKTTVSGNELLNAVAEKCCKRKCSISYLRSFCCNTANSEFSF